jgi:hypothetical protein
MQFKKILKCHSQDLETTHDCGAVIRPAADLWQHYMQFCRKLSSVSTFQNYTLVGGSAEC